MRLATQFEERFGRQPTSIVAAPGRVNLIGEHTDYNEGYVLPVAVDRHIYLAASPRADRSICLYAKNLEEEDSFSLDQIGRGERSWSNYPRGVAWQMEERGHRLRGMEGIIWGELPMKAGLGSSAALEVAVAYTFQRLSGLQIAPLDLALLCQRAKNEFVGVRCGLMDQLTIVWGKGGHALLIDCRSLTHEPVPIPQGVSVVVADTKRERGLLDSQYNARRRECEEGARLLGLPSLRDISLPEFQEREGELSPLIRRRLRHVVRENQRVLEGAEALRRGDLETFGHLMYDSHRSLRHDYEVSCLELDTLVEAAQEIIGVYGSRLTGAGFGGCTVSLVAQNGGSEFEREVARRYQEVTPYRIPWEGMKPDIYIFRPSEGVHEVEGWR